MQSVRFAPNIESVKFRNGYPCIEIGDFHAGAATAVSVCANEVQAANHPVLPVVIDSYGGDLYALTAMIDIWESSDFDVITFARGKAYSCGAIALAFGTKGLRFISPRCSYMLHNVSSTLGGTIHEVRESVEHAESYQKTIYQQMARRCGKPDEFFLDLLDKTKSGQVYLTPEQCIEYGIADHIGFPNLVQTFRTEYSVQMNNQVVRSYAGDAFDNLVHNGTHGTVGGTASGGDGKDPCDCEESEYGENG